MEIQVRILKDTVLIKLILNFVVSLQIDDCRRTNNYDPFICTFLTMLAEQGKLSALVEKHTVIKRRQGIPLGSLQKSRKRDRRRPRSRPKKTKLK